MVNDALSIHGLLSLYSMQEPMTRVARAVHKHRTNQPNGAEKVIILQRRVCNSQANCLVAAYALLDMDTFGNKR